MHFGEHEFKSHFKAGSRVISLTLLTHSLGITGQLARNADSEAAPQTYLIRIYSLSRCSGDANGHLSLLSAAVQMPPSDF